MEKEDYTFYCDKCRYGCKFKSEYDKHCDTGLHKTGKRKPRSDKKEDKLHKYKKILKDNNKAAIKKYEAEKDYEMF